MDVCMTLLTIDIPIHSLLLTSQICVACLLLSTSIYFFIKREKRLHALLSGILFFWFLLHMKDLLLLDESRPNDYLEHLCICIDMLAVPTCAFLLFELTLPGWFSWRRMVLHIAPFLLLLGLFAYTSSRIVFYIDIAFSLLYSLWVVLRLFRTIPAYNRTLRENLSNTENLDLEWLWKLLIFFILFLSIWAYSAIHISIKADILYNVGSALLWCVICHYIHKHQPLVLFEEPLSPEPGTALPEPPRPGFARELDRLFEEQKIWLNPHLTISEVAQQLGSNRTYLSDYLNRTLGTTFYEYVNDYRVRAVAEQLSVPECSLTIEAIAENCGFNSISTFRRVFVRRYGCTPMRYRLHQCQKQD